MSNATLKRPVILVFLVVAGILSLAIAIEGIGYLRFLFRAQSPEAVAMKMARSSVRVKQALGEPLRVSSIISGNLISRGGFGNADLNIHVVGPLGRGRISEWAQENKSKWSVCSLSFKPDDSDAVISLVDEASAHCERE